jgi:uncharacterized protein (TIGR02996 family)
MHRNEEGLIRALLAAPQDDALRLVYADWLEEQGDVRSEFLRLGLALAKGTIEPKEQPAARQRIMELRQAIDPQWLAYIDRTRIAHRGRAYVCETFSTTAPVGTVAGCHVLWGVLERSARIRVIRHGTVIYPPADCTAGVQSLRRFDSDVGEVREGFECGLKITDFDDVRVGDVIEAFHLYFDG